MSSVTIDADRVSTNQVQGRQHRAKEQRDGLSASTTPLPSIGRDIADIGRSSKSP
jgi:hypothetical protein